MTKIVQMDFFKIFRRKKQKMQPKQLRIDGIKTELTPAPDDAELAAQALLEAHTVKSKKTHKRKKEKKASEPAQGSPEYYKQLAERIKKAKAAEVRRAKRFLTYAEQQLDSPLMTGQTGEIERELYKLQDVAEREGGELLKRWQHCLAECVVRQMNKVSDEDESTDTDKTE